MSQNTDSNDRNGRTNRPISGRDLSAVRDHRDDLEDLARSDLPVSWVARALLDAEAAARGE
ncbi:hypothetical protein [Haloferax volcanii]|uniref:Uncharacterized protein n=3 Tax=Haloferax volcanii TaxID=2246 RepID=D4GQR1_HALVD|nr:hypothetical protein [Haloferax volcanii]ADE02039.1 uncharacterized protein HVO_A0232 [Haloferax volcanii DS2]ELY32117.1 hypothetical protein C498_09831 [Haloferax volcanii DS2]MBS8120495.1 hypothetical protein [Haloferax volcanii]MBS8125532.1 hypothetical protein [Haloferax volcanii]MBS8129399.1 hypothetical protein [Haloferax volcanii]